MGELLSRRKFLRLSARGILGASIPLIGGTAYMTQIEPEAIEITHLNVTLPNLPPHFDGLSIVQVSDWHLGEWMTVDRMIAIARSVNDLRPDIIVLTGDFIGLLTPDVASEVTRALAELHAPEGIFAILGNHDYWASAPVARRAIHEAGNTVLLLNQSAAVRRANTSLYVVGVDDVQKKRQDLDKALLGIPRDSAVILLAHEPDFADQAATTGRIGLQLSGHSHGGQIRIPGRGALLLPELGQKYDMGLYHIDQMLLYTNRGVGMISPYIRFNCRPEITRITLRAG